MFKEYWEVHEGEYETLSAILAEEDDLLLMEADYAASHGRLWD